MNPGGSTQNSRSPKKGVKPNRPRKTPVEQKEKQNSKSGVSSVKGNEKEEKYRSGSLSRQVPLKAQESPRKAQSMDRYQSSRKTAKEPDSKNHTKKSSTKNPSESDKGNTKSESSNIKRESRKNNMNNLKTDAKSDRNTNVDNPSRTKKTSKPKTNLQIAKSFVQSSQVKSKKTTNPSDASPTKKQDITKPAHTTENNSILERPRTSTIQKGPTESVNSQSGLEIAPRGATSLKKEHQLSRSKNSLSGGSDSEKASYEEDFEDYDSDFEESDSESISETSYSDEDDNISDHEVNETVPESPRNIKVSNLSPEIKQPIVLMRKASEKTFLKLSDRSSLFLEKNNNSDDKKPIKLSRSYINFESAVAVDENIKNPQELNEPSNDLEYKSIYHDINDNLQEKYKHIGRSTLKQACIQTENCEEEEMQTDEIEMLNKWTQNPVNGTIGYGGDQISLVEDKTAAWKSLFQVHSTKLSTFLQRSSNIILTLLEEEFSSFQTKSNKKRSDFIYSDGYYTISPLNFLTGIPIVNMSCCSDSSPYIITIHGGMVQLPSSNDIVDDKGLICVWNILESSQPEYILTSNSQPTCGTFGPGGSDIVIGGMVDGAVMLWDLSDLNSNNLQVESDSPINFRSPTFNTAVVLGPENHKSCIVGIKSVYKSSKSDGILSGSERTDSLKSFHVLTLEDMGVINIWVVVEVLKPGISGLESDLGLAPGGKFRLVKSACLPLHSLTTLQLEQKNSIRTFDFQLVPYDSSRMLVTTDAGIILHVTRHSGVIEPRYYSCEADFNSEVRCLDCSPHNEDLFLVGCSDGSIKLYSIKLVRPMLEFLQASKGEPVNLLQWSVVDPCVFCVLSSSSCIYLWNLMEDSIHPIYSYNFEDCKVTWFVFKKGEKNLSDATSNRSSNLIIAKESGDIEVHTLRQNIAKQDYRIQYDYMQNL